MGFGEQCFPGLGEDDAAMQTPKESAAKIPFKIPDLVTDGARRNVQFLRRMGEAQVPGGSLKGAYRS